MMGQPRTCDVDELEALEGELAAVWPDPHRVRAELATGATELAALRAELDELDGPKRSLDFAIAGSCLALATFLVGVLWMLRGVL
jgi:hypothetical protein